MSSVYQENGHYSTEEKTENNNLENMAPVASSQDVMELANSKNNSNTDSPEQQFKVWRQMFARIASSIHKAGDINTLTSTLAQEIREKLETDRVFVYRFTNEDSGVVIAESRSNKWTPARNETLPAVLFGLETNTEYLEPVIIQVQNNLVELSAYQTQLLDKYQVKSSLSLPIILEGNVWGLLVVHSCGIARTWQESEITLLSQLCAECKSKIVSFEYQKQLQRQEEEHQSFVKVIDKIQRASSLDRIFQATTQEIRQMLQCDRVAVYRFNPDWSGEFVAESVAGGWMRLVGNDIKTVWEDTHLQETQGGRYKRHENLIANDIYKMGHSPCHVEILEQFEIKAYATVPVFAGNKLWGLLAAYQNSNTREWQEWEVKLLNQFAANFGVAVLQVETLQQTQEQSKQLARTAERQQSLIALTRKIGEALTATVTDTSLFDSILQTTVAEVRRLLEADRTVVYRFNPDWSGEFIAESIAKGWIPFKNKEEINQALLKENGHCDSIRNLADVYKNKDTYLQDSKGGRYQQKTTFVVDDVKEAGFPPCYMELLEQFEAKAYLTVPIFKENKLWAFLATYQHSAPRKWEAFEVTMMEQVAALLGAAMQQAETFEKLQRQSQKAQKLAALDSSATSIIDKIRQSMDMQSIFNIATKEVRALLKTDRVTVYRFNPDWSGLFVAESVGDGWVSLLEKQNKIPRLQESISSCYNIRTLFATSEASVDTYLRATEGGELRNRRAYVRPDIHNAGFPSCYTEVLDEYQVKSYAIVPIFQGSKLWGMLAAFENSGTREWEESEISLLSRIGDQLGIALQQTEYLEQLQSQSTRVAQAVEREKEAKEYLQKGAMQLLSAVRPALNGDLTVRAPISEDELGTIADAYNNTLQALRQIVVQVQGAAQQVASTSSQSSASLSGLTHLAQQQSKELNEALGEIQQMVDSTQAVVGNAELVQLAVQQANQTVESGDEAMNLTVEAIQGIRETVSQTSKKIKRLSESSQKISKVVNLISNFATQTNVLALNAAIEATRAGEYGKGFAVVADEVRSLSRQSAAATIEIEKLVQEIQEETGEVAVAMETGIQQVVEGTNLVNQTRLSLNAIVVATAEISQLLQQITDATQGQMLQSVSVTASMKDVAKIANKTSAEASNITTVFNQLSEMAQELLSSASKFKVH